MQENNNSSAKTFSKNKVVSSKGADFVISAVISLIFFLCPLFFTGTVAQGIGFEKMMVFYLLVLIGIVFWVIKGIFVGELKLKRTPLDVPILITLVVFVVSTFASISTKDSLIGAYGNSAKSLVAMIVFVLFYYLLVNNINTQRLRQFFGSFIISGSLVAVYSLLQLKGIHLLPMDFTKTNSFNPLGSLSSLTMFLVILLPLLVVAATQAKDILPKASSTVITFIKSLLIIVIIIDFTVLIYLSGFTFWPVGLVSMVIVTMFFLAKIIKVTSNNLFIPITAFIAALVFFILGNFNFFNVTLPAEVSLSRGASWEITKSALKENPFLGSGPSTFYYDFSKFKSANFNSSRLWNVRFDSASGSIFELLSTVGVAGAIAMITIVLIALSVMFLTLIKTESKGVNSLILGLFSSTIAALLYSILYAQNNSLILINVLVIVLATSAGVAMYPEKFKDINLSFRSSPKYALAFAAISLCVSAGVVILFTMGLKMYLADKMVKEAMAMSELDDRIETMEEAIALAPYQDSYYLSIANSYMALANKAAIEGSSQTEIGNYLSKAIELGRRATEESPEKAANNESLALIYENASFYTRGALEHSERLYNKVIELDPQNPTPHLRIALVNMARANAESDADEKKYYIEEALKKYDEAILRKADIAAAYYGKAVASEKLGNLDDAIEQLKNATIASRNNLDYRFELGRLFFNRGVSQLNLDQTATKEITTQDTNPNNGTSTESELSVTPVKDSGPQVSRNSDLNIAEQLFLSIIDKNGNPNHANSRYSLAVLYQKLGETEKARIMAQSLIEIIKDESTKQAVQAQFADILK